MYENGYRRSTEDICEVRVAILAILAIYRMKNDKNCPFDSQRMTSKLIPGLGQVSSKISWATGMIMVIKCQLNIFAFFVL